MKVSIRYAEPATATDGLKEFIRCRVYFGGEPGGVVNVIGQEVVEASIGEVASELTQRWVLERIRALATSDDLPRSGLLTIEVGDNEVEEIRGLPNRKTCRYRKGISPEFECSIVTMSEGRSIVEADCQRCGMPDDPFRCAWSAHPSIPVTVDALSANIYRSEPTARCGRPDPESRSRMPTDCRIGGHGCWEIDVSPAESSVLVVRNAEDVAVAIDLLAAEWALRFGRKKRLYRSTSAQAAIRFGSVEVNDRDTFVSALQELVLVLDSLRVPKGDFDKPEGVPEKDWDECRDLQRLSVVVEANVSVDAEQAASDLRVPLQINNAMKHERKAVPAALAKAGVDYPITNWGRAWASVLSHLHDSLLRLARELRAGEDN